MEQRIQVNQSEDQKKKPRDQSEDQKKKSPDPHMLSSRHKA